MTIRDRLFWEDQQRLQSKAPRRQRVTQVKGESTCKWFLLCENPATTTLPHPTLGDVPCCERCATKIKALS